MALQEKIKLHNAMKRVAAQTISPTSINVPPSPPSKPHVANSSLSTVIVFACVIASLLLLGLYCSLTRRRSISDARERLFDQLRNRSIIPSTDVHRPANVSLPVRKYMQEEMRVNGKSTEECPVCLVEFEENEEVKVVDPGCEHMFHPVCIDRWLAMRDTCPVCRSAIVGDETEWSEVWIEGQEWDSDANANTEILITEQRVDGEGEGGEVVMNVENMVVSEEGNGYEGCDGEVVISVEGEDAEREEGEEEVVAYVGSVVLSEDMDVRMNVETESMEMEMEVNVESGTEEEGEQRITMEEVGVNMLEGEEEELVDDTREKL